MNNDTDCLHEECIIDVQTAHDEMIRRGAEAVVLLGNSGGGSLMAMAHAELGIGDGWVGMAAHPGEGVFMLQVIDPSVADEHDRSPRSPELDMYNPDNGWRPWPEPCSYDPDWWRRTGPRRWRASPASTQSPRHRSRMQPARAGAARHGQSGATRAVARAPAPCRVHEVPDDLSHAGRPGVPRPVDRSGRPADGVAVRVPRPVRRELRPWRAGPHDDRAGLAVDVVGPVESREAGRHHAAGDGATLLVHPTADTEIRLGQAKEIVDAAGAADVTYIEMKGAPHYLEGHRPEALAHVAEWIAARFP